MKIVVTPYVPPIRMDGLFYRVKVVKISGKSQYYVVHLHQMQEVLCTVFTDQYDIDIVRDKFFMVDYFTLDVLLSNDINKFGPDKSMQFSKDELQEFFTDGIGAAIHDFVVKQHPHAVVAVPVRAGLAVLYDEIMQDCTQRLGYTYNDSYKEFGLYVIETQPLGSSYNKWANPI